MTESAAPITNTLELDLPAEAATAFEAAATIARSAHWAARLHDRDVTLWSAVARVGAAISERLGWLDAPAHFADATPALEAFGDAIREAGFRSAIVMGMGGSSLAPEVLQRTFGSVDGYLDLRILDSTDPAAVAAVVDDVDPLATLWIVASKSGATTESLAFQADAWARVEAALARRGAEESAGELMIAITDPGRSVEAIPHHDALREVFLNPTDIGGRYSAVSYVGLVPASLIGLDLDPLLASAATMLERTRDPDPITNPGLALGLAIGTLARAGRDKLTFLADPEIAGFGPWAEQLIAESTGKHGVGIVPVDLEPFGDVTSYGPDRAFVRISLVGPTSGASTIDALAADLRAAGQPLISISLADPIDLGGEFIRWEVATAIAGVVLGIDPFDQPDVEEAKELTRQILAGHASAARGQSGPVDPAPIATSHAIELFGDAAMNLTHGDGTLVGELARHLARRRSNAYLGLQAFIAPTPARDAAMARIRAVLRNATRCATTAGYGPRFLHSTGQLHKGGAPIGLFLQLTADHRTDREIPGMPYTFGQLIDAQARGDRQALEAHDIPVLRVHLGADADAGLAALESALSAALSAAPGSPD